MDQKEYAAFGLSIDEVYVLLKYLNANLMLGFSFDEYEKSISKYLPLVVQVVERALMARGFLGVDVQEKRLKPVALIQAILGACLYPDFSIGIDKNVPGKLPEKSFFHIARKMHVLHSIPSPDLHQFMTFRDKKAMMQAVLSSLEIKNLSKQGRAGEMETKGLHQVGQLAGSGKLTEAKKVLAKSFDNLTSDLLIQALEKPVANISILSYITLADKPPSASGMALLVGNAGLWKLEPVMNKDGSLGNTTRVIPITSEEATDEIVALFPSNP